MFQSLETKTILLPKKYSEANVKNVVGKNENTFNF